MASVLDHPEVRETVFPMSVAFYHEAGRLGLIGEEVELLQGVIFRKMPKSPLHQRLIRLLQRLLQQVVPASCFVDRESPISCADSEPEPDLAVIEGNLEAFRESHPTTAELVIEIAISTQQRDRSKAPIYAAAGVKEYWLIEPEAGTISLFNGPSADGYANCAAFPAEAVVTSTVLPAFAISLAALLK
jgi:Uma2 family endonuclease